MKANVVLIPKTIKGEDRIEKHGAEFCLFKTIKSKRNSFLIGIRSISNEETMLIDVCGDKDYIVKFK